MSKKQKNLLWRIIIAAVFFVPLYLISEDIVHTALPKAAVFLLFLTVLFYVFKLQPTQAGVGSQRSA